MPCHKWKRSRRRADYCNAATARQDDNVLRIDATGGGNDAAPEVLSDRPRSFVDLAADHAADGGASQGTGGAATTQH